ncbi:MAG TPA: M24 family metallopeptidase [Candidatus Binatia bacterium]|jgi:Xaa-Pro aminopeptidase
MHPTLLIGPYDWQPERMPKSEFLSRSQALWKKISDPTCAATIVYGDSYNHAELVYFSNFVPKLGPAIMFIPREGEPKLLVSGAPNMLMAARRLTWIEAVEPLRDAGKTMLGWLGERIDCDPAGHRAALIGGDYMRSAFYKPFIESFGDTSVFLDATPLLRTIMRCKSPRELGFIREACAILAAATKALAEAHRAGASITAAVLDAERVANHLGAQDVRTLFSLDGGRTLRPFEKPIDAAADPLQAYIAVRHVGYWSEGFVFLSAREDLVLAKAAEALNAVIAKATVGTRCGDLARIAAEMIRPFGADAMSVANIGNGIGLSLEEEPRLSADNESALGAGEVYTLRVGISDGRDQHSIVSAMVAVHQDRSELLWSGV